MNLHSTKNEWLNLFGEKCKYTDLNLECYTNRHSIRNMDEQPSIDILYSTDDMKKQIFSYSLKNMDVQIYIRQAMND